MSEAATGQITSTAAQIYEDFFVPALFREPAAEIVRLAQLRPGMSVLDVACGTGVLARAALRQVGPNGAVAGLDRNAGMLDVARTKAPAVDWREGRAEALPFQDGRFDAVLSQFGLMFFDDRGAALREMRRVARPGGIVAAAVWDSLDRSPGYAALAGLLERLFGPEAADALRAPFTLGDRDALLRLMADADMGAAAIHTVAASARFPSLEAWMHTEIRGWTLAETIDDRQYQTLLSEARRELKRFVREDGTVAFACPALVALQAASPSTA